MAQEDMCERSRKVTAVGSWTLSASSRRVFSFMAREGEEKTSGTRRGFPAQIHVVTGEKEASLQTELLSVVSVVLKELSVVVFFLLFFFFFLFHLQTVFIHISKS